MFAFWCPRHRTDVLVWPSDIDGIVNTVDGICVRFHCGCGFRGVLRTGAGHSEQILAAVR